MKRIKTGDNVKILAGKDKNATGNVLKVIDDRVIVENVNMCTKAIRPNPKLNQDGGFVQKEASIHVSNVALLNPATNKADRVGFKYIEREGQKNQKVRYFKSNGELVDTNI